MSCFRSILFACLFVGVTPADEASDAGGVEARVMELVEQLGSERYPERQRAVRELTQIGRAAKDSIARASRSEDPEVRIRAGKLLESIRREELRAGVIDGTRELHVVGCYEGGYPPGVRHRAGHHPKGSVEVIVDRPGAAVTLVLCSYEPVRWSLRPVGATLIEQVILSGFHPQELVAGPEVEGCEVVQGFRGAPRIFAYDAGRKRDRLIRLAEKRSGLELTSVTGAYALNQGPVRIDQGAQAEESR